MVSLELFDAVLTYCSRASLSVATHAVDMLSVDLLVFEEVQTSVCSTSFANICVVITVTSLCIIDETLLFFIDKLFIDKTLLFFFHIIRTNIATTLLF